MLLEPRVLRERRVRLVLPVPRARPVLPAARLGPPVQQVRPVPQEALAQEAQPAQMEPRARAVQQVRPA